MWYALANFPDGSGPRHQTYRPQIDTGHYEFLHVLEDIQSLNERAEEGELEITALSIHQFPYVRHHYALTSCGASMGDGYGPLVVARPQRHVRLRDLPNLKIAVPGWRTSAWLALSLLLGQRLPNASAVRFDQIIPKVAAGEYDAGLIIHEGQLTYAKAGLACIVDLGDWWMRTHGLPLPLGGNAIRRDLGPQTRGICQILLNSIQYALEHRDEAVAYALNYARDMDTDLAARFVGMYVNQWTLDYGEKGREAVRLFLAEAAAADLVPDCDEIDFVEPL